MNIKAIPQGSYQTNSYVINEDGRNDCVIIDTGLENNSLSSYLSQERLRPAALLLTHGHLDHIKGVETLRKEFAEMKVYIHKDDADMLADPEANMSAYSAIYSNFTTDPADELLEDGQKLSLAGMNFEIFHIPGHSKGGIAVYVPDENVVFTGDCLFAGSIGRTDFPGCQEARCRQQLIDGIKEKLLPLDENTRLFPGHGPATTIRCEKKNNPYINDSFNMFAL